MSVRWPDGSLTGSVQVTPAPTPVEPEPAIEEPAVKSEKKEVGHGDR